MQIVIDIPEEKYNAIQSDLYNTFPAEMKEWGLEAIRNGTPLHFKRRFTPQPKTGHWIYWHDRFNEWNGCTFYYKCSECGRQIETSDTKEKLLVNYPYCYCGAKMIEPQEKEVISNEEINKMLEGI